MFSLIIFLNSSLITRLTAAFCCAVSAHNYWICRIPTMKCGHSSGWLTHSTQCEEHCCTCTSDTRQRPKGQSEGLLCTSPYTRLWALLRSLHPYFHYALWQIFQNKKPATMLLLRSGFHLSLRWTDRSKVLMLNTFDVRYLIFILHSVF